KKKTTDDYKYCPQIQSTRQSLPEHCRETARFWRENRAEAALREQCLVPAEEYERFAQALEQALAEHQRREEERILQMAADIREAERRQRETVQAALQVGELYPALAAPWEGTGTAPRTTGPREGPGAIGPDLAWLESGKVLTFIGYQVGMTGAKPPWLTDEEDGSKQIGPSYEEFLKHKEKQKLKKLPVERVGANFDHTSQTNDSWLPSFGRVWNHGRRWQSRHQFRTESGEKKKQR
uniref:Centrosomal AT-AC splicing factor n=1 Tax=Serinus canaria TaxID=9135 RepID=A0A8C9UIC7_SERCA